MRTLLLAATALAMLGGAAYAQSAPTSGLNTNGASSSNSAAKAVSSTRSAAHSVAVGNSTTVNVSGSGTNSDQATTTGSDQYIGYGGGYTLRNTPEVIPPSVVGGNACAVGARVVCRWQASASLEAPRGPIGPASAGNRRHCCSTWASRRWHSS